MGSDWVIGFNHAYQLVLATFPRFFFKHFQHGDITLQVPIMFVRAHAEMKDITPRQ